MTKISIVSTSRIRRHPAGDLLEAAPLLHHGHPRGRGWLDLYKGASFTIGNKFRFDLRAYRGHPEFTVTLYLPEGVNDENEISEAIDRVIKEMVIPPSAVAWRRGQSFEFGETVASKGRSPSGTRGAPLGA